MKINQASAVLNHASKFETVPVHHAMENLKRDIKFVCLPAETVGDEIHLVVSGSLLHSEGYEISVKNGVLQIAACDEMGFIYGIYAVSRELLGVHDFWFWNDQQFARKDMIIVPEDYRLTSMPVTVRYRGWFVNDEVLIHTWMVERRKDKPWEMVFEALLRCGGNMVIPGTDKNARKYRSLARDMGLIITHHHAEPLGAEMFARAYPELQASYAEYPEKFHELWKQALDEQDGYKVIWNLGFRGQGDRPFWEDDPKYATPSARGALMSQLIQVQYDLVQEHFPDAVCATNLYGETMELYREGYLHLPKQVIKIWADNGYGAMVSRRQGNHNPRIPALPKADDKGAHGIYYHASFYDLQAANHITMLPNSPEFVYGTLRNVLEHGVKDFWIVNCSNVKPHVFTLGLIARIWRNKESDSTVNSAVQYLHDYVTEYFGAEHADVVEQCFQSYYDAALHYGCNADDHAGEQFANHVARMLVSQYMRDENQREPDLLWATSAENLSGQIEWYLALCQRGQDDYTKCVHMCEQAALSLPDTAQNLLRDTVLLQVQIYQYCYSGAVEICRSLQEAMKGRYQAAFYHAGTARAAYHDANAVMRGREHGKWHDFYANECLTDIKQTAWLLGHLMGYLRNKGDGPYFYQWQREFLYAKEDTRVVLITNMENHLTDEELFDLMKERWQR